ncbi:hypothetical protein GCM10028778_22110 [Barrientosiimonas marina]|uniref:DUF3021 domain-containing protein n=1 Tax=Lentibacillus kimchii TaxID=1542911 RepID=A0ABW2UVK7_9BACI
MGTKILFRSMMGFAHGGIFTLIYMTILNFSIDSDNLSRIWLATVVFMLIGLYFGFASSIYENENWSLLKKTIVHFSVSLVVFHIIMLGTGLQSLEVWPILLNLTLFVLIYAGFWIGHVLYYKKMIKDMNNSIK